MRWTDLLALAGLHDDVPALTRTIITRTRDHAETLVGNRILGMSRNEATGYVRARLRRQISAEVTQAIAHIPQVLRRQKHADVCQATVQSLTQHLLQRASQQRSAGRRLAA